MAKDFAESIDVQGSSVFQEERQFHSYWSVFLWSTWHTHCHIIHTCSHWHTPEVITEDLESEVHIFGAW